MSRNFKRFWVCWIITLVTYQTFLLSWPLYTNFWPRTLNGLRQEAAFNQAKGMLNSSDLLVHYETHKELVLSCDASPYRLSTVLSHIISGKERSISYASRNLSPEERNYAQLDKEGAVVIFGLRKLHQYVYGQKFIILTDHKPPLGLFKADKAVLTIASPRIQRWALLLEAYNHELV